MTEQTELICEHFEIPETICCEYCTSYPICPLKAPNDIWDFQSEVYEWNWNDIDWPDESQDDYDYTEGDIGQDGII